MVLSVFAVSAFVYCLILSLLSPVLSDYERIEKRLDGLKSSEKDATGEELSKPFVKRVLLPVFSKLLKGFTKFSGKKNSSSQSKLERELRQAGIRFSAGEFTALKRMILLFCLAGGVLSLFIGGISPGVKLLILLFALILGILIPRYYLKAKIKKRQNGIRLQLPDVMDLLSVSVEAGLGFDAALLRVGEKSKGALIDELTGVYREIQMGKPRKDAFKGLGERSSVEELKNFAGAIVQAEQLGIPIRNVLTLQSKQLRQKRRQAAEEKAMKAPVKMMLPLVVFIFPVIFIILLGPSVMKIIQVLG